MDLDSLLARISTLSRPELDRVHEAVTERRKELAVSGVIERRGYGGGILQLEWRADKAGNKRHGPYWYYYVREEGRQRSMYVGKTAEPETVVEAKLRDKRGGEGAADRSGA